jgi:two-component system response regulator FixJ
MNIQSSAPARHSSEAKHSGEIFLVDDDDNIREKLTLILSMEGLAVTGFADGASFLAQAEAKIPICVFLDVIMPGRSGLQILKELSARRYQAPIFMMSARDDIPTVVEGLKSGAQDFLHKPFDPYRAIQLVRHAVELWGRRTATKVAVEFERTEFPGNVRLTRRESEVLAEVIRGVSRKEIAASLAIKKSSVEEFISNIRKKFGAKNTIDLVRIVMS